MPRLVDRETRKAQLAEAVWQVILDEGISAVSVRTVAEQAGVVLGSLRHVFPTRAELVVFSAELMEQRATERILATPPSDEPRQYALDIIKNLLPITPDSRAELEINLALFAEHAAVPELTPIRDNAHTQISMVCTRVVQMLTGDDAIETPEARRLHALIDGLALHLLHQPLQSDTTWAIRIIEVELQRISDLEVADRRREDHRDEA